MTFSVACKDFRAGSGRSGGRALDSVVRAAHDVSYIYIPLFYGLMISCEIDRCSHRFHLSGNNCRDIGNAITESEENDPVREHTLDPAESVKPCLRGRVCMAAGGLRPTCNCNWYCQRHECRDRPRTGHADEGRFFGFFGTLINLRGL